MTLPAAAQTATTAEQLACFASCVFDVADIVEVRRLPSKRSSWHRAADLPEIATALSADNRRGENVYAGVNPRKRAGGRAAADVSLARCLFVDFDGVLPARALETWRDAGLPDPTLVVASGHGCHIYLRLVEPVDDLAAWSAWQRDLAVLLGGDEAVHDAPRVTRLPGFANLKEPERPVACRIVKADPARRCELADLHETIPSREPLALPDSNAAGGDGQMLREGARNTTLTRLAGTMRRKGFSENAIGAALTEENRSRCRPPLDDREVASIAHSVARYAPATPAPAPETSLTPEVPWPSPLDEAGFHGLAGDIVRAIEPHSEADPVALLLQVLVAFGSAADRNACYRVEGTDHCANLFVVLVGATAKGRKGTAWAHVRRLFEGTDESWTRERVASGLSSGEGLIWQVRDPITKRESVKVKGRATCEYQEVVVDSGVDDKRLLVVETEFASTLRVLGRDGNTLSPVVRQAWDLGELRTLTKNSPARATGAHISVVGHVTRDELRRYLNSTEAGNGFGNRILWACVRRSKCLPEGGRLSMADLNDIRRRLGDALVFAREAREVAFDDEARQAWHAVYPELSEGKPGLFGAVTSRAEAQVVRLALVYALLDRSPAIRVEHLTAALVVWEYCEASARHVFGDALGDPVADEILAAIRRSPKGLTRTEIRDLFGRHVGAARLSAALALLLSSNLAIFTREDTGGRPAERWQAVSGAFRA